MKLKFFCLFILASLLSVRMSAQSGTERITVSFQNLPLEEALNKIKEVSGYVFSYDVTQIDAEQKLSVKASNEELRLVIRRLFEPTAILFHLWTL